MVTAIAANASNVREEKVMEQPELPSTPSTPGPVAAGTGGQPEESNNNTEIPAVTPTAFSCSTVASTTKKKTVSTENGNNSHAANNEGGETSAQQPIGMPRGPANPNTKAGLHNTKADIDAKRKAFPRGIPMVKRPSNIGLHFTQADNEAKQKACSGKSNDNPPRPHRMGTGLGKYSRNLDAKRSSTQASIENHQDTSLTQQQQTTRKGGMQEQQQETGASTNTTTSISSDRGKAKLAKLEASTGRTTTARQQVGMQQIVGASTISDDHRGQAKLAKLAAITGRTK